MLVYGLGLRTLFPVARRAGKLALVGLLVLLRPESGVLAATDGRFAGTEFCREMPPVDEREAQRSQTSTRTAQDTGIDHRCCTQAHLTLRLTLRERKGVVIQRGRQRYVAIHHGVTTRAF